MHLVVLTVVAFMAVMFTVMWVLKKQLYLVAPNQLLVISGRQARSGGRVLGYRSVRGGRAITVPWLERAEWLDLSTLTMSLDSFEVLTRKGLSIRLNLHASVRIATAEPELQRALESLLGKTGEEITGLVRQVVIGTVVGIAAGTAPEDFVQDAENLQQAIIEEVSAVLDSIGLELETLRITPDSDERYFAALAEGQR